MSIRTISSFRDVTKSEGSAGIAEKHDNEKAKRAMWGG
jgi:hypothetical protein